MNSKNTLPKARGYTSHQKISSEGMNVCEIQITYNNDKNLGFSVELPLEDSKFVCLQEQDPKIQELWDKVKGGITMTSISLK